MNKVYFNIPIKKSTLSECLAFYSNIFGFNKVSEIDFYLTSETYVNVGIGFIFEKRHKTKNCYLFFEVNENISELYQKIKSIGCNIEIIEDTTNNSGFTIQLYDPSENLIQIYCQSLCNELDGQIDILQIR